MIGAKKVLIVDDSIAMRMMISDILKRNDFEIAGQAPDGIKALEMYKQLRPDIVTMDIVMPNELGIESMKKILQFDPKARIVVISGLHQKNLLMEALEVGAKDYIIKPFTEDELVASLRKASV